MNTKPGDTLLLMKAKAKYHNKVLLFESHGVKIQKKDK